MNFNLLPWREQRWSQQRRRFLSMIIILLLISSAGIVLWHIEINSLLKQQHLTNRQHQQQINNLEQKHNTIKGLNRDNKKLWQRVATVEKLQRKQLRGIYALQGLAKQLPATIRLLEFNQQADQVTITGEANNHAVISNFVKQLNAEEWVSSAKLQEITNKNGLHFIISCELPT